jgi:prepilin-type N-terminal cleavage/methylation domain-containing protein
LSIRCYTGRGPSPPTRGFTLIEVIGALLIFSTGVLMVINYAGTLSLQMERAALRSELAVVGQERLDSLELVSYASLTVGTTTSSMAIRGETYSWSITVNDSTALIKHARVTATPGSGVGPAFSGSTFSVRPW